MAIKARFYDGTSATGHDVTVSSSASRLLIITSVDGAMTHRWLYKDMFVIERPRPPVPGRLGTVMAPDARLIIKNKKAWKYVMARLQKPARGVSRVPATWRSITGLAVLSCLFLLVLFLYLPQFVEKGAYFVPQSLARSMGRKAMFSMETQSACVTKDGMAALSKLTEKMSVATADDSPYSIAVIEENDTSNALTFPGGYIILYSGLLKEAQSQEEVAGILAHEMGHAALRHATKALVRDTGTSLLIQMALGTSVVAGTADFLNSMRFNRDQEREADLFAVNTLINAGINPAGMIDFFERYAENSGDWQNHEFLTYLLSHPASKERIASIKQMAISKASKNYRKPLQPGEWHDLKNICAKTTPLHDVMGAGEPP